MHLDAHRPANLSSSGAHQAFVLHAAAPLVSCPLHPAAVWSSSSSSPPPPPPSACSRPSFRPFPQAPRHRRRPVRTATAASSAAPSLRSLLPLAKCYAAKRRRDTLIRRVGTRTTPSLSSPLPSSHGDRTAPALVCASVQPLSFGSPAALAPAPSKTKATLVVNNAATLLR
ncbi:uncharacterized protein PSFLO_01157 [Pseudozyma flocculosa]|uniref:Uncharacterized protein n=1 Tax=Pseudozyma flocculosa TaxID=84751 RepID=A0A5C3EVX9_9BASI|nr:uncharacterized protein PSFLO_01157 [Pseudozyma flocculosa]